jgi:hypothetical protein
VTTRLAAIARHTFGVCSAILLAVATARPAAAEPRLFFTDLQSGPASGGESGLGVFVTLWGEGFGAVRGGSTVSIGGHQVARYVVWGEDNGGARGLDMIVVQPGPGVASGNVVVAVAGVASNPLPFTVRAGDIFFVSTTGSDGGGGSFASPWRTLARAREDLGPGDVVYLMNGVSQTAEDAYGAALSLETSGAAGAPLAIVAYPGAIATIGSTALEFGVRVPNNEGTRANDWVLSKLVLRGQVQALDIGGAGSRRWRVVGNDISCPIGDGQTGCFAAAQARDVAFLGNHVHGIGQQGAQPGKQYHAVYFTTDTNHVEVGWNHIHDNRTCRALQFHSSPLCVPACGASDTTGYNQFDLLVHDNLIHGDVCDGINFATVDPSRGPVRAWNNVIYEVGRGPSPPDGDANYAGIHVAGGTNNGADGTGAVEIFNNTLYDCGRAQGVPADNTDRGAFSRAPGSPALEMRLENNIVLATAGAPYIAPSSDTSRIGGSHNLWSGAGDGPAFLAANVAAAPGFASLGGRDFHLLADSPAVDAGVAAGALTDHDGGRRPAGAAPDLGAFERGAAGNGGSQPCVASSTALCLRGGRFQVSARYRTPQGSEGAAQVVQLTGDTGYFWFFSDTNVEVVLKVLDGCPVNGHHWVFAGGLTDVEVRITVTDSESGAVRQYSSPLNTPFRPLQDTSAFGGCG